ncbi:MAG: histidine--tRNA ligase [Candidatus Micrarchaeota archaeon]
MLKKLTPKGMRDFLPEEMIIREWVLEKIATIYRLYGFRPLSTPALEYMSTLEAKSGDEILGQIFKLENEEVGLRFDLTVPLARVAATNAIPKPFKRYSISAVWRKEEPQKGRMREFWQADADIIGSKNMRSESELLVLANDAIIALGFDKPLFILNNRKILDALVTRFGVEDKKNMIFRLLDKIDRFGLKKVREDIEKLMEKTNADALFDVLAVQGTNTEKLAVAKKINEEAAKELEEIIVNAKTADAGLNIIIDFFLVRGLEYYTGPIFEIKLSDNIGSVGGGGRYDNLLGFYGQNDYATGISLGIERLIYLIKERENKEQKQETKKRTIKKTYTRVFVASVKGCFDQSVKIAGEFRKNGISTEVDLNERSLSKQFDYANALDIEYVAIVGEKEIKENKIRLRNMRSGAEELITLGKAMEKIKKSKKND